MSVTCDGDTLGDFAGGFAWLGGDFVQLDAGFALEEDLAALLAMLAPSEELMRSLGWRSMLLLALFQALDRPFVASKDSSSSELLINSDKKSRRYWLSLDGGK
eukprot:3265806-Rhodomonas_salina.1